MVPGFAPVAAKASSALQVNRQMLEKLQGEVSAQSVIAVAAGAADARDLNCALIEVNVVVLVGQGS